MIGISIAMQSCLYMVRVVGIATVISHGHHVTETSSTTFNSGLGSKRFPRHTSSKILAQLRSSSKDYIDHINFNPKVFTRQHYRDYSLQSDSVWVGGCVCVCVSVCLCLYGSVYLPPLCICVCLSLPPLYISVYIPPSLCLCLSPSLGVFVFSPLYVYLPLSVCLSLPLSMSVYISLYIYIYVCLPSRCLCISPSLYLCLSSPLGVFVSPPLYISVCLPL